MQWSLDNISLVLAGYNPLVHKRNMLLGFKCISKSFDSNIAPDLRMGLSLEEKIDKSIQC